MVTIFKMRIKMSKRLHLLYNKDGHDCASPLPASSFEHPYNKGSNNIFIFKMKKPRHREKLIAHLANLIWNPAASLQNPQPPLFNTHDAIFKKNSK